MNQRETNRQMEAQYRVTLKRIIRAAQGTVDNEAHNGVLESMVKQVAVVAPATVAKQLDRWFDSAARAWERGNNSGNNELMRQERARCDRYRHGAAKVLLLWGIKTDYPGLYPSFNVRGYDHHRVLGALKAAHE